MRLDARYHDRSNGGRLEIINHGSEDIYDLDVEMPEDANGLRLVNESLPVPRLPAGKSVTLYLITTMNSPDYLTVTITGRTAEGHPVREEIIREHGGMSSFSVPLPLDSDGFLRRECPHCIQQFKWHHGPTADRPEGEIDPAVY